MVTNGGYGGVQQALANGVPLVVAGDSEDKPEVAARVAVVGHRHQPAHRSPLRGDGGPRRAPRPHPAVVPGAGAGAAGRDRRHRPAGRHQRATLAELCRGGRRTTRGAELRWAPAARHSSTTAEEDAMIEQRRSHGGTPTCVVTCRAGSTISSTTTSSSTRPIVFTPQRGKQITSLYLQAAGQTFAGTIRRRARRSASRADASGTPRPCSATTPPSWSSRPPWRASTSTASTSSGATMPGASSSSG